MRALVRRLAHSAPRYNFPELAEGPGEIRELVIRIEAARVGQYPEWGPTSCADHAIG